MEKEVIFFNKEEWRRNFFIFFNILIFDFLYGKDKNKEKATLSKANKIEKLIRTIKKLLNSIILNAYNSTINSFSTKKTN